MRTYKVLLKIRGECKDDVIELLENYTGEETDIEILEVKGIKGDTR